MKKTGLLTLVLSATYAVASDMLVYYPNGDTATAPYSWQTVANWYETNSFNALPSVKAGMLPTSDHNVLIQPWGGVSLENPVTIGESETVTVKTLRLASNEGGSGRTPQLGAGLLIDGGVLDVLGNFYFALDNHTSGDLILRNGAKMSVGGAAQLGANNYTVGHHCRVEIDETSELDVEGQMTVGRRARCAANVVTNRGTLSVGSMMLGPCEKANVGTGIVHNAGHLLVEGDLDIGGLGLGGSGGASKDYCWSRGELVLAEGSELTLGDNSSLHVGGNHNYTYGDGILDISVPLSLKAGQSITIGNAYSNALYGGALVMRKNASLDIADDMLDLGHYQYGKARLIMHDNSCITNIGKIRLSDSSRIHSYIEMHDNTVITNIHTIRISQTTGVRNGGRGHIIMDGNSAIHFNPKTTTGEGSGILMGTVTNNYGELVLKDNALLSGLLKIEFSTAYHSYEGRFRLEGGRVEFEPQEYATTRNSLVLGVSGANAESGLMRVSGYGTMTRNDIADPDPDRYLVLNMQMYDYSITADGDGEERDLDMRAFYALNYICQPATSINLIPDWGNLSGTNGWYATDKGRLIFPRGDKALGRTVESPACQIGDWWHRGTNELGQAMLPELVNSFTLEPETDQTGWKAYCHSALYAPDRTDYPSDVLKGRPGKVVSVWRIGTCTTGWTADDPITPWKYYTAMKVAFRYDHTVLDGDIPLKLYRHDGTADGAWRTVAVQATPSGNHVISGRVTPGPGTYDLGWFALVEQRPAGSVISLR